MAFRRSYRSRAPMRRSRRVGRSFGRRARGRGPYKRTARATARPRYNPTWNPQFLKVKRNFQFTGPSGETGGTWPYNDLAIQSSASNVTTYEAGVFQFTNEQFPGSSEYGHLFDQYRITGVKLVFKLVSGTNMNTYPTSLGQSIINIMVWNDYDDDTSPANTAAAWKLYSETGRTKQCYLPNTKSNALVFFTRPRISAAALDSAGSYSARMNIANAWQDGAATNPAKYLGCKWMLQANPSNPVDFRIRVNATFYMQYRQRH